MARPSDAAHYVIEARLRVARWPPKGPTVMIRVARNKRLPLGTSVTPVLARAAR